MHREGLEPSADPLEEGCSDSIELPVRLQLHRFLLGAFIESPFMHPAGFEPATNRLRAGGSAVELRVRSCPIRLHYKTIKYNHLCFNVHWEGVEPSTSGFVDRNSDPVELPVPYVNDSIQYAVEISTLRPPGYQPGALPLS
jgi:hypothetical protein